MFKPEAKEEIKNKCVGGLWLTEGLKGRSRKRK